MKTYTKYLGNLLVVYYFYDGRWTFLFKGKLEDVAPWTAQHIEETHRKARQIDLLTLIQLCF